MANVPSGNSGSCGGQTGPQYDVDAFIAALLPALGNRQPSITMYAFLVGWATAEAPVCRDNATGHHISSNNFAYNLLNMADTNGNVINFTDPGQAIASHAQRITDGSYQGLAAALKSNDDGSLGMHSCNGGSVRMSGTVEGDLNYWVGGQRSTSSPTYIANVLNNACNATFSNDVLNGTLAASNNYVPGLPYNTNQFSGPNGNTPAGLGSLGSVFGNINGGAIVKGLLGGLMLLTGVALFIKSMAPSIKGLVP